jgi:hypothetical protein
MVQIGNPDEPQCQNIYVEHNVLNMQVNTPSKSSNKRRNPSTLKLFFVNVLGDVL